MYDDDVITDKRVNGNCNCNCFLTRTFFLTRTLSLSAQNKYCINSLDNGVYFYEIVMGDCR